MSTINPWSPIDSWASEKYEIESSRDLRATFLLIDGEGDPQ